MSRLIKWQAVSLSVKIIGIAIGLIQAILIVRLLPVSDYGLVGIVLSVASMVGVYQHLGLASGTVREISVDKDHLNSSKIFLTSLLIRILISFPLCLGLFLGAKTIALKIYHQPTIVWPLQTFALILLLQGNQDIATAVLSGLQKFKTLFSFQLIVPLINLLFFASLVFLNGFKGYFQAFFLTNLLFVLILWFILFRILKSHFFFPSKEELIKFGRSILGLGVVIYLAKILYTFWQRIGVLFLGVYVNKGLVSISQVGFFTLAVNLGLRLTILGDAVTSVNNPILIRLYSEDFLEFKKVFLKNYSRIFALITFATISSIFFAKEVVLIFAGSRYLPVLEVFPFVFLAFMLYAFINIFGVLFVAADKKGVIAIGYITLAFFSAVFSFLLIPELGILGAGQAIFIGVLLAFIYYIAMAFSKIKINLFEREIRYLILIQIPLLVFSFLKISLVLKMGVYFLTCLIFVYVLDRFGIFRVEEILLKIKEQREKLPALTRKARQAEQNSKKL